MSAEALKEAGSADLVRRARGSSAVRCQIGRIGMVFIAGRKAKKNEKEDRVKCGKDTCLENRCVIFLFEFVALCV